MRALLEGAQAETCQRPARQGVTAFYMKNLIRVALAALTAALVVFPACATDRDPAQRKAFQKSHPCPANHRTKGACPGYVVDHIKPLCAGGRDHPSNMQWQTVAEAKKKDKQECRAKKRST